MEPVAPVTNGPRYELHFYCNPNSHRATAEIYDTQRRIRRSVSNKILDIRDHDWFFRMRGNMFKTLGADPNMIGKQMTHAHRITIREGKPDAEQVIVYEFNTDSLSPGEQ